MTYTVHPGAQRDLAEASDFYVKQAGKVVAQRFRRRQFEIEITWKARVVAADLLIQPLCLDAVKRSKVAGQ